MESCSWKMGEISKWITENKKKSCFCCGCDDLRGLALVLHQIDVSRLQLRDPPLQLLDPGVFEGGWHHHQQRPLLPVGICHRDGLHRLPETHLGPAISAHGKGEEKQVNCTATLWQITHDGGADVRLQSNKVSEWFQCQKRLATWECSGELTNSFGRHAEKSQVHGFFFFFGRGNRFQEWVQCVFTSSAIMHL